MSLHYVTRESYDVGPVVGEFVDERRDGKRDNECKDDTDDSDDSSVFHMLCPFCDDKRKSAHIFVYAFLLMLQSSISDDNCFYSHFLCIFCCEASAFAVLAHKSNDSTLTVFDIIQHLKISFDSGLPSVFFPVSGERCDFDAMCVSILLSELIRTTAVSAYNFNVLFFNSF